MLIADRPTTSGRRGLFFALAALGVVLFALRGLPRLREPGLFAEDGQIFLADAHNLGLRAFLEPYAGYLHTIPRIVAAALEPLPITAAPVAYLLAAMILHLAMLTPALSPRLSALLPHAWQRAGLFLTLCVMPAVWEVYGNVANAIFVAGTALVLLALSADPRSSAGRLAEVVAIALLGLSGPLVVLFLPLVLWRWWRTRTSHAAIVSGTALATALVQLTVYLTSARSTPGGGTAVLLAKTAGERVGGSALAGKSDVFAAMPHPWLTVAAYSWFAVVVLLSVWIVPRIAIPLWITAAVLLAAAVNAYGPAMVASGIAFQRHVTTPLVICLVLLWLVIGRGRGRAATSIAVLALAACSYGVVHDFAPEPYPSRPDLTELQRCVSTNQPVCDQPIFGPGWTVELRNP
ncbi:hypothetical protein [Rhodococcoides trifolii]|uniref:hypothetical protein n=1 Tax=Rhodococcoides trifolii TaxID=908250 RepID=UPI0016632279|nr:hypothetical protein [Rhodococcus trifolii]